MVSDKPCTVAMPRMRVLHLPERLERLADFIIRHSDAAVFYSQREGTVRLKCVA